MNRFLYIKNVFTKEGEDFKNNFGQKVRGAMAPWPLPFLRLCRVVASLHKLGMFIGVEDSRGCSDGSTVHKVPAKSLGSGFLFELSSLSDQFWGWGAPAPISVAAAPQAWGTKSSNRKKST